MLNNKTILITWASDWLGKSLAKQCIDLWAKVIGIGRTASKVESTQQQLGEYFYGYTADLSQADECTHVFQSIINEYNNIDILVNNIGIRHEGPFLDHDLTTLESLLMTNVFGVMATINQIYPIMKQQGHGQILTVNSLAGINVGPNRSPYTATKFALNGFITSFAEEAQDHNIKVSQIFPWGMNTNLFETYKEWFGEQWRMMDKDDVAKIIINMLSQPDDLLISAATIKKFGFKR